MATDISALDAVELDALIARASLRRSQLDPAVPREAPKHTFGEKDPTWYTFLHGEVTVLQLRHSGLGWFTFGISPNERAHLTALLLQHALMKQTEQPQSTTVISEEAALAQQRSQEVKD